MPVAKEQIRQIIADNNISSVADVYTLLRDGFKDILPELMEAEFDAALEGYDKRVMVSLIESAKVMGEDGLEVVWKFGDVYEKILGEMR